jgi:hypothetical protein
VIRRLTKFFLIGLCHLSFLTLFVFLVTGVIDFFQTRQLFVIKITVTLNVEPNVITSISCLKDPRCVSWLKISVRREAVVVIVVDILYRRLALLALRSYGLLELTPFHSSDINIISRCKTCSEDTFTNARRSRFRNGFTVSGRHLLDKIF